jgi:hypothetical protein
MRHVESLGVYTHTAVDKAGESARAACSSAAGILKSPPITYGMPTSMQYCNTVVTMEIVFAVL